MNIKFLRFIFATSVALLMSSTAALAEDANTIVVGQAIDLSSPNANIGRDYVAGIKTYFDALNAAGGINGRKIRYVVKDDQGVPATSAKMVTELIERDQADFLIGGVGDNVTQAVLNAPAFARSNLVLYAPLVDALDINNPRILYWRPGYAQEVRYILTHFGPLGMKDVAIAYQDTAAGQSAFQKLSAEVRARGLRLTGTVRISGNERQNSPQEIARLAESNPGFVIVIADTFGSAFFLKEFRKNAPHTFVAGTSLINLETVREIAGPRAVEWTVFSQVVPNPATGKTPIQLEHMNMIRKYRDEPASSLTFEGFAAAKTLVKAIQRSSKRPLHTVLPDLMTQGASIDLGGLAVSFSPKDNHLSGYLDIALFNKNGLVF
jgi:ABC-type branched-subunit amino acid transport system substrate-binding protein